ncbi:hypothetical protein METUNv1_01634 [Methyloversatilis universalis FAM5]|uniref:Uncharacterized protein n=1 Tax=Methyloversatilis universalis (strain ATCC BAA-1314 / DSM 25237 / JCM 13912 / CCUG 52030 / FAM5) TaxID=1000565 RepID=F5RBJ1_METUF|nr:hypothetical protein METUNv1_01634 [Methyloversatilis universalis FAM5]
MRRTVWHGPRAALRKYIWHDHRFRPALADPLYGRPEDGFVIVFPCFATARKASSGRHLSRIR